ncbi:MAG: hypothetical protein H6704_15990 [Myxococcales bacterium]|nr:hypothetical protein [Myxococcales bacterium]
MPRIETTIWQLARAVDEATREVVDDPTDAQLLAGAALADLLDRATLVDDAAGWSPQTRSPRRYAALPFAAPA